MLVGASNIVVLFSFHMEEVVVSTNDVGTTNAGSKPMVQMVCTGQQTSYTVHVQSSLCKMTLLGSITCDRLILINTVSVNTKVVYSMWSVVRVYQLENKSFAVTHTEHTCSTY